MNKSCRILKKKLELYGLKDPDELQRNTVTQHATTPNPENPSRPVTNAKSQVTIVHSAVNSGERKTQLKTTKIVLAKTITNN